MRRFYILLFFVLIACMVQTSEARKVALLIGVDDYMTVTKLRCCVNDMKILKEALMNIGFEEDDIYILVTGASDSKDLPTKRNIERILSKLLNNVQPDDEVFLALSGHGAQEGKNVYFCPMDAEVEDLAGTCVSINKVMDDLSKCQAKFKWMIVDACRNDPTQGQKGIGGKGMQVIPAPPAGIALFQSCSEGELSWEDHDSGNGFFTKNFAAALSGEADTDHDGKITLMDVCKWTTEKTRKQVMNNKNRSQRPYFSGSVSDFILTENWKVNEAYRLAAEAQKAENAKNYELAIQKYDEAIALFPLDAWKVKRTMLKELVGITPPIVSHSPRGSLDTPGTRSGERRTVTINSIEFTFVWCSPGEFMMGSSLNELYPGLKEKQHKVTLTKGFWMMEKEVTQKQWKEIMGANPSFFKGDDLPVECVTWNDCQDFCKKCNQYGFPVQLPTEAQWEYACRAGTTGTYAGSLDEMAWHSGNSGNSGTHPVGTKKPNAWGLYDMHGNVLEWCADSWSKDNSGGSETASAEPSGGSLCVSRGGCWNYLATDCRSASRFFNDPEYRYGSQGFRVIQYPKN